MTSRGTGPDCEVLNSNMPLQFAGTLPVLCQRHVLECGLTGPSGHHSRDGIHSRRLQ